MFAEYWLAAWQVDRGCSERLTLPLELTWSSPFAKWDPQEGVWSWHWLILWWVSPLSPLYRAGHQAEGVACGHLVLEVILCKPRLWFLHDVLMLKPKYKTAAIELWFMVDFIMNATSKLENSYHLLFIVYGGCSSLIGCLQLSVILHNFILMCQCFSYICWCLIVVSTRIS